MYAIVQTGGKQYKAEEKAVLRVEKLDVPVGEKVELDRVLLVSSDQGVKIGTPVLQGARIIGKVLRQGKARKINGFTYMPKKHSSRHYGHRQPVTEVLVEKIEF
jgi:large subunit ribosomal protein L21